MKLSVIWTLFAFYCALGSPGNLTEGDRNLSVPIFILGMPRTGSSLLEQMLGNHSSIEPMGELPWLPKAFEQAIGSLRPPRNQNQIREACKDSSFLTNVKTAYYNNITQTDKPYLIDKLPGNFLYTGIIHAIFPGALVIHTKREKHATVWSCYKTPFVDGQGFSHDIRDASRYYDEVEAAIASAASALNSGFTSIAYEDLVNNPEQLIQQLLEFLQLPFEAVCLEHTKAKRLVSTASRYQVTQPVFKDANSAWKPFEPMISARF